jgi:predicted Zn-dependent protease
MYHALNVLIQLSGESAQQGKLAELLSTHPNTHKRAAHVKEMCEAAGYQMTTPSQSGSKPSSGGTNSKPKGIKMKKG